MIHPKSQLSSFKFQAEEFIDETGIDALAVCIGNVHGKYPASGPNLRLDLLKVKYKQSNVSYFSIVIDYVKLRTEIYLLDFTFSV